MPFIEYSTYHTPLFRSNGHFQSIYPTLFRKVTGVRYEREQIDTPDGDFLDLDWSRVGSRKVAILSHGLEGDSNRHYILGQVKSLNFGGWDACAWNFRGCSGATNRTLKFYHSGATYDLDTVIQHIRRVGHYDEIALIGYSLGGNMTLKYLGDLGEAVPSEISASVVFSAPVDLAASSLKIGQWYNKIYMMRFLRSLHGKIRAKMPLFPDALNDDHYVESVKNFKDFDDRYTAPIHGFKDAADYWAQCSSKPGLAKIKIPTLLVSARNDPFLTQACFPVEAAKASQYFHFENPKAGGHVGFMSNNQSGEYWSDQRAVAFLEHKY